MSKKIEFLENIDKPILILFIVMIFMGWLNIFAAEVTDAHQSIFDIKQNYGRQLLFIITSLVLASIILFFDAKFFPAFAYLIYGAVLVVLIGVLFFGVEINASRSWFRIGNFGLQPAEFAKYATALAIARFLSELKGRKPDISVGLKIFAFIAIPVALIFLQNDTGTMLVFSAFIIVLYREGYISGLLLAFGILAVLLFVLTMWLNEFILIGLVAFLALMGTVFLRRRRKALLQFLALSAILSGYIYFVDFAFNTFLQPHQRLRVEVLFNEEVDLKGAGYNLHQSKIAIGSGGFWGKGYLKGTQTKYNFVPEQSTDFIFCTIGEEWGFVGSLVLISMYIAFIARIILLAERQRSIFSRVFGYSVASILFFHFFINIGMTIGMVPVIGIPLPFFSYGGSSLWSFTILIFTFLKLDSKRLELF